MGTIAGGMLARFLSFGCLLALVGSARAALVAQAPVAPRVAADLAAAGAGGEAEFLIVLEDQADLSGAAALTTKAAKGRFVVEALRQVAERSQPPILRKLASLGLSYRSFYVLDMILAKGNAVEIATIAAMPGVARIDANPAVPVARPIVDPSVPPIPSSPLAVEWNIVQIKADQVWTEFGTKGQGVVVAGQDTGIQWDHPALKPAYRGWNGSSASHDYNWHDSIHSDIGAPGPNPCGYDSPVPCDDDAHGTHTLGTVAGDDGGSNQIGVAPGAKWIGCRNMDNGDGTPATYTECFEFFLAPYPVGGTPAQGDPSKAPDVINNSWGCPSSEGCSTDTLKTIVDNVRAAGIDVVVSAGNSGSSCSSVSEPPALYASAFSVGASSSSDTIASFSSRGPVTADGSNRLKPEITAPGVNIRSSIPGSAYQGGWNGTSMAGPHVAGSTALLMSAFPGLLGKVDAAEKIHVLTAVPKTTAQTCGGVPGSQVPNNTYGYGILDSLAAARMADRRLFTEGGDYSGDFRDDIGVFRNGAWFLSHAPDFTGVDLSRAFGSFTPGADEPQIGELGCLAAGGGIPDFQTDLIVLRKASSTWFVDLSNNGWDSTPDLVKTFGTTTHKRVPTRMLDTNGDGCSDLGVFRNGCFDVLESPAYGAIAKHVCFGLGTDEPQAGDLDGDRKGDLLLWRAASSHFSYRLSSESYATDHGADLGGGDAPLVGDLDGDGMTDLGSYKPSVSTFRFTYSPDFAGTDLVKTHGTNGDIPILADVNGDGKTDIGIFRNAAARWWFQCSPGWSSSCLSQSFGTAGDVPVFGKPPGMP